MKNKKRFTIVLLISTFLGTSLFAQSSVSIDEPVLIQIKKGLSMSKVGGDLDFGEYIVTTSDATISKNNEDGVNFEITGHPNRSVTVSFADVTLNNNVWVGSNGGTVDNLTFSPDVESTAGNNTYTGASSLLSGGSVNLANDNGVGKLYLWVGGDIDVSSTTNQGDYVGTFTISVAY